MLIALACAHAQGRGIETNLYAQFKCDSLKIGMVIVSPPDAQLVRTWCYFAEFPLKFIFFCHFSQVKHQEVAQFLGGRLYDCVFKYNEVLG